MSNPTTIDRRDVAQGINPIGGHEYVEELEAANLVEGQDPQGLGLPAGVAEAYAPRVEKIVPRTRGAH